MLISKLMRYVDQVYESNGGGNGYSEELILEWINQVGQNIAVYKPGEKEPYESIEAVTPEAKTLCDEPYDQMYVDFILAQMAKFDKDFESYQQHIASYNNWFSEYMMWVRRNTKEISRWEGWL